MENQNYQPLSLLRSITEKGCDDRDGDNLLGKMSLHLSEERMEGPADSLGCCPCRWNWEEHILRTWEGTDAFWGSSTCLALAWMELGLLQV